MMDKRCDWCSRAAESLLPVEGERLCFPCSNHYLDGKSKSMVISVDGVATRLDEVGVLCIAPGSALARSANLSA